MESAVPVEDDPDEDNEPGQDQVAPHITNCLCNPDILGPLLKNFSNNELLRASLVNKLWNYEARWVLKARGNLIATTAESNTCVDLEDLAISLQFMKILPYFGMNIKLGGQHECTCKLASHAAIIQGLTDPNKELDVASEEILDHINWRILSVQFNSGWLESPATCPGLLLLEKILENFSSVLQELSIRVAAYPRMFLIAILRNHTFPNLKILKFQDVGDYNASIQYTNFIKQLVSRAPTLQTLYTRGRVDLSCNLQQPTMALHLTDYPFSPSLDQIPERAVSLLRLERMTLIGIHEDMSPERCNGITHGLLNKSQTTLKWMEIDAPFLVPLMIYGVSLKNVRTFMINFDYSRDFAQLKHDVWNRLESFDFTRTFPNLSTVHIYGDWKCTERLERVLNTFAGMVDEGRGKSVLDDRAVNIKNLELEWNLVLSNYYVKTFAKMFPNVKRLSIQADGIVPFDNCIYGSWPDLEELDISILGVNICLSLNLDTDFCGIFSEELVCLREEDDEYLQRVNILPVMPSVTSLKSLKSLKIALEWESKFGLEPSELGCPMALFSSKVTPLVAFKKCPNLTLTLKADDERVQEVLTHLQPYLPQFLAPLT